MSRNNYEMSNISGR